MLSHILNLDLDWIYYPAGNYFLWSMIDDDENTINNKVWKGFSVVHRATSIGSFRRNFHDFVRGFTRFLWNESSGFVFMCSHSSSQMNNKMLPILTNIKASVLLLSHKVGYTETPFRIILGFGSFIEIRNTGHQLNITETQGFIPTYHIPMKENAWTITPEIRRLVSVQYCHLI